MVPKDPPRIDVATLERRLRDHGVVVHRRTIQRDLVELARVFPLVVDFREKPFGWRWADGAEFLCSIPILRDPRGEGAEIVLCLRVERALARTVAEGLRGRDGDARRVTVTPRDDGYVDVTAHVLDVCALRRWLLGFGDAVEVLSPDHVRAEFVEKAARIAARYRAA
jgi:predicted DNA-binding transcriptional regulator YafY